MRDLNPDIPPAASLARSIGKPALEASAEGQRVERLPGAKLQVEVGSTLSLRLLCVGQKYEGELVGHKPFGYLIVQARLPSVTLARLPGNPDLVVQYACAGALYGFRSTVLSRLTKPAPILFLAYPESLERIVLRRDERVRVSVPGTLLGRYGEHEIMLTDLTPSGCSLSAKVDLKSPLRDLAVGERLLLNCDLGRGQAFTTPFVLRRMDESRGLLLLGGQFVEMQEATATVIENFVRRAIKFMR